MQLSNLWVGIGLFLTSTVGIARSFTVPHASRISPRTTCPCPKLKPNCMLPEIYSISSISTAVEVFDGSNIVDPVVVSDIFWASLKSKILAVIIGQVLATIAFGLLSSFLASQITQIGDFVSNTILKDGGSRGGNEQSTFIKANEIEPSTSAKGPPPDLGKLLICLAIDVLGSSSELLPVLGEVTDVLYAPIAATILRNLYGSNILFGLEFAEEILPFTDILPLATICWVIDSFYPQSDLAKVLQLGAYSPKGWAADAIDTSASRTDRVGSER